MYDSPTVVRLSEIRHRNGEDPCGLGLVHGPDGARLSPPPEHGRHDETTHGDEQLGQDAEELDARWIETGLLLRLAQRRPQRADAVRIAVLRIERAARKRPLA